MKFFVVLILSCIIFGVSVVAKRLRLTNNDVAQPNEFPYQVSIQIDSMHFCGGSLISKKHVLTAAHCMYDHVIRKTDKNRIKVVVGTTYVHGGIQMGVARIAVHYLYRHSDYNPTLVADISVIGLTSEIMESANVRPIALPYPGQEVPDGTQLIVSGFGASVFHGPTSNVLKKMYMKTLNHDVCQRLWPGLQVTDGHMCAALAPGYGVCQGDSGGPLTLNKQVIVGIISATSSQGCGTATPDLFAKVSHYLDFIKTEMAMN